MIAPPMTSGDSTTSDRDLSMIYIKALAPSITILDGMNKQRLWVALTHAS